MAFQPDRTETREIKLAAGRTYFWSYSDAQCLDSSCTACTIEAQFLSREWLSSCITDYFCGLLIV